MSLLTLLEKRSAVDRRALTPYLAPVVILLGTVLRLAEIGTKSYWLDEIKMIEVAGSSLSTIVSQTFAGRPPVFVYMAHFWMQWFGTAEGIDRALSAIFGSLALIVMYLVGRELLGETVSLIATFLMAISEFQIDQSQNFRYYAVFMFFALVSFYAYVRALRTGKRGYWIVYVVSTILTFYSHTHGAFLIAAQGLYFVLQFRKYRPAWLPWLISQIVIFLALLPGLLTAFGSTASGDQNIFQWIRDPKIWTPLITMVKFVLPGRHAPAWLTIAGAVAFGVAGVALFVALKGRNAWISSIRDSVQSAAGLSAKSSELLLIAMWLVLPMAFPLALSKVFGPMYVDRYVIGAAPALYLLIALVVVTLRKVVPQVIMLGALVILITPGLYEYYTIPTNEQWREAATYIHQNVQPNDRFIFAPGEGGAIEESLDWYYRGALPGCGIEASVREPTEIAQQMPNCIGAGDRFWLIVRGYPERVQPYQDFFLSHPPGNIHLVGMHKFKDVDVYLFDVSKS